MRDTMAALLETEAELKSERDQRLRQLRDIRNLLESGVTADAIKVIVHGWIRDAESSVCSICRERHPSDDRHPCE